MAWEPTGMQVNPIHGVAGVSAGAGVVDTGTMRVTLASDDPLVDGGATESTLGELTGSGLTFERVKIDQAVAGTVDLGGGSDELVRLHTLVISANDDCTVQIKSDDDGAGTNAVDISGDMVLLAGGGMVIPFQGNIVGCLAAPSDKHMTLVSVTAGVCGWAIVSVEDVS